MVREEADLLQGELDFVAPWWRNRDGTKIHRQGCRYAREPWRHAAEWSEDRIVHYVATIFFASFCSACCKDLLEVEAEYRESLR